MRTDLAHLRFFRRWRIYFAERFPIVQNAAVIAAFVLGVTSYGMRLRHSGASFAPLPWVVAFATVFLFFLQLRIHDEFKDFEDDARWRPYRPVPRGVVSLASLGWLWLWTALCQLLLALLIGPPLIVLLLIVWAYSWLMRAEFFVPAWLKARPIAYMASHIVIVPLMTLYALACVQVPYMSAWRQLSWLLLMSYSAFFVVEIGRKIRAPENEEPGVETYTALWGRVTAVLAWLSALAVTALLAVAAALRVGTEVLTLIIAVLALSASVAVAIRFLRMPAAGRGVQFQIVSGLSIMAIYLAVGDGFGVSRYFAG